MTMKLRLGAPADCSDGTCGRLTRLVLDPVSRTLTHVVVEPADGPLLARLVPIDLVADVGDGLALNCTFSQWRRLEYFEDVDFTGPAPDHSWGSLILWPLTDGGGAHLPIVIEHLPAGEVEISEVNHIRATDGHVGRVGGLVVDSDFHVTDVLVRVGHLWRKREAAIPAGSIEALTPDGIADLAS
jgi:hypothetical protein